MGGLNFSYMKICIFAHTFPRFVGDTAAAFMDGFCEGLQNSGNEVIALIPFDTKITRTNETQSYKVRSFKYIVPDKFHLLGYSRVLQSDQYIKPIMLLLSPFYYIFGFFALLKLVMQEKIEIINAHWIIPGGIIAALVSYITGVPLVITVAGSDVYLATRVAVFKYMALFAAARAKFVVGGGSSLWTQDLINLGVDREKTQHTIIYGVDPLRFFPSKNNLLNLGKKLKLNKNNLVVLAVGRLVYKKGMHVIIDAIPVVVKKYPNIHFIIVGDGDQRAELQERADQLNVSKYLTMPGTILREELRDYYNLCDIYVSASIRDQKGNVDDQSIALVEVMACKKPTIASDLPGNKLVVKDGINGFLFKMGDSNNLARKIADLLKNSEKRKKFAQKSYKLAQEQFSINAVGESYGKLFKEVISSK